MRRFDYILLAAMGALLLAGFSTLYSIGVTSGEPFLYRQTVALVLGGFLFLAAAFLDYRGLASYSRYLYIFTIILLVAVLVFADDVRGSARWLTFGEFNLQPSELAKIALILVLARFFAKKGGEVKSSRVLVHSALFMLLLVVLIMLQPDLGSALLLGAIWFLMLIFTPIKKKHLAVLFLILTVAAVGGWYGVLHDYQKERVATFLNPEADPQGSGYNVRQAIIAVGSGQILGRGLGRGFQSHLKFLPERHTDFIFASFAEELGFLGAFLMLVAFGVLLWRLVRTALISADSLGMFICLGTAGLIATQVFVNIGMNMGLAPVTGITLPLVSYGGSSLIFTLLLLGLSQGVYRRAQAVL